MRKRKYPKIDMGLKQTPAELDRQAHIASDKFICRYGRIQALSIVKLMIEYLKTVQDEPTKMERDQQAERIACIKEKADKLKKKLERILEED